MRRRYLQYLSTLKHLFPSSGKLNMKSIKEKLTAEHRSEELEQCERYFTVKYLGSQSKLGRDYREVERAVAYMTKEAFTAQKKRKQLSIYYTMLITEQNVSLFTQGGNRIFSIPVEKMSYSFNAEKKYYILSLAKHVSAKELDVFVICCDSTEKLNRINSALYFVFRGRRFSLLRAKREKERKELTMRLQNAGQRRIKMDNIKANPTFTPKEETSTSIEENVLTNGYTFTNRDDNNPSDGLNKFQLLTKQPEVKYERYSLEGGEKTNNMNTHTTVIDVHHDTTKTESLFDSRLLVANGDTTKQQFDRSTRRYPRSSWC